MSQVLQKESGVISKVYPIVILFSLYTLFYGWIPRWGGVVLLSLLVGVLVFAFSSIGFSSRRYFVYFVLFIVIIAFKVLMRNPYWKVALFNLYAPILMMLLGLMVSNYYLTGIDKQKLGHNVIVTVLCILVFSTVATAVLNISNPQVIRYAVHENNFHDNKEILNQLYRFGMCNYSLPHALPVIFPPLVCLAKNGKKKKSQRRWAIISIVLCIILIYISGAMTALLLGLVSLLGSFVITENFQRNIIRLLLVMVVFLPLMLNDDIVLTGLQKLESVMSSDNYFYKKIIDFENAIVYDTADGDLGTRNSEYTASLQEFIKNPILGTSNGVGGHSVLLDFMATLGLVGFTPFLLMLLSLFNWDGRMLPVKVRTYYAFGFLMGLIMLGLKSMNNIEMWFCLFALLPILSKESVAD